PEPPPPLAAWLRPRGALRPPGRALANAARARSERYGAGCLALAQPLVLALERGRAPLAIGSAHRQRRDRTHPDRLRRTRRPTARAWNRQRRARRDHAFPIRREPVHPRRMAQPAPHRAPPTTSLASVQRPGCR